ncbi:phosphopantetheine-binding protein [Pontibacillus litoralis]|nr:phosphopantetheine-binding protein [Pontibacillus litoralis]
MLENKLEINNSNDNAITIEKIVVSAWKDILQVDSLKLSDNFFDLGGDSISSLRIALRLKKSNTNISPTAIFSNQTIEELVNHISEVNTN